MYPLRMEIVQPLLKKAETGRRLAICPRMVDYLVSSGLLPCVKIGSAVRFKPEDVQAFIESKRRGGSSK